LGVERQRAMPPARTWLWFALILLANILIFTFRFRARGGERRGVSRKMPGGRELVKWHA
jgi:hypothetical protein